MSSPDNPHNSRSSSALRSMRSHGVLWSAWLLGAASLAGGVADWSGVYAAFMLASLLRSIGITPGGLGVFEGGAVSALHWAGIALPVALSATLLFRGLSFWAPMLPGILVSRSALR